MWLASFFSFLLICNRVLATTDCVIHVTKISHTFKIFLNGFHWLTPLDSFNGTKEKIAHGETVQFICDNGFVDDKFLDKSYIFQCNNGKLNKTFSYEDLLCRSDFHKNTRTFQVPSVQLGSKILKCEEKGLEVYQVKAQQANGDLKHLYTVCFDKNVMRTKFVFQPKRVESGSHFKEPRHDVWGFDKFGKNAYEKLKLSDGYVSRIQKKRITSYFPYKYNKKQMYPYSFNRGHLAPYSDFFDHDDKKASCQYINVAPQWNKLNGNSWSLVERETRDLVRNSSMEWEIYTGTYGSIPTIKGPLFLSPFFDTNGKFLKAFVPVPKLYWKLVYNTLDNSKSRAFVGVNNPELKSPEEININYLLCKPKSDQNGKVFRGNEFKGFTYECAMDEFLEKLAKDERIVKVIENYTAKALFSWL